MSDNFTLRVPFELQPGKKLLVGGKDSRTSYQGFELAVLDYHGRYKLEVSGFADEKSATAFVPRAWAGLTSFMIQQDSGVSASYALGRVVPVPADNRSQVAEMLDIQGFADEDTALVYPTGHRVGIFAMPNARLTHSQSMDRAMASLVAGLGSPGASAQFQDERFRAAVELYSGASFEQSPITQLLMLAMAFEVLAPVTMKGERAQRIVDGWRDDLAKTRETAKRELADPATPTPERESLRVGIADFDALDGEILFRRETSIRRRVLSLVAQELAAEPDVEALVKRVDLAYKARSTLLHDGKLDSATQGGAIDDFRAVFKRIIGKRLAVPPTDLTL